MFRPTGFFVSDRIRFSPSRNVELVDVDERERLDDAEPPRLGDGGDELRVRARVHRPAEKRHLDAGHFGEPPHRLGPTFQTAVARATVSPFSSRITLTTS